VIESGFSSDESTNSSDSDCASVVSHGTTESVVRHELKRHADNMHQSTEIPNFTTHLDNDHSTVEQQQQPDIQITVDTTHIASVEYVSELVQQHELVDLNGAHLLEDITEEDQSSQDDADEDHPVQLSKDSEGVHVKALTSSDENPLTDHDLSPRDDLKSQGDSRSPTRNPTLPLSTPHSAYALFVNSLKSLTGQQEIIDPNNLFQEAFNHFQQTNRSEWIRWMNSVSDALRKVDTSGTESRSAPLETTTPSSRQSQSQWIESKLSHIESLELEAKWKLSLKRLMKKYQSTPNSDEWLNNLADREALLQRNTSLLQQEQQVLEQKREALQQKEQNIQLLVEEQLRKRQLILEPEYEKKHQQISKLRKKVDKQKHQAQLEERRLTEERNALNFEKEQFEQRMDEEQKQMKKEKVAMKKQLKFLRSMENVFRKKSSKLMEMHSPNQSHIIRKLHDTINQMESKLNDDDLDMDQGISALSETSSLMSSSELAAIHSPRLESGEKREFSRTNSSSSPLKTVTKAEIGIQTDGQDANLESPPTHPPLPATEDALREQQELFSKQWEIFEADRKSLQRRQRRFQNEEIKLRQEKDALETTHSEILAKQDTLETTQQKMTVRTKELRELEVKLDKRETKVRKKEAQLSKREKQIRATAKDIQAALKDSAKELAIFHEKRQKMEEIERLLLEDYQRRHSGLNSPRPRGNGSSPAASILTPRGTARVLLQEDGEGMSGFQQPNLNILAIDFNLRMKDIREREKTLKQREKFCFERETSQRRLEAMLNVRVDDCRDREERLGDREKRHRAFELRLRRQEREAARRMRHEDYDEFVETPRQMPHTAR